MNSCASCACAGVAVFPVPIAHTGSYAITSRSWAPAAKAIASTWIFSTSSVSPDSRCSSVSPTQAITPRPASSAARARRATVSSVSPKSCRRSEWPTSAPLTPSSSSISARSRRCTAPLGSQCTFCAYTVRPAATAAGERHVRRAEDDVDPLRLLELARGTPRVSPGPLNIFQLPAISTSCLGNRRHARELLALEQLERGAAARRDPR